MFLKKCNIDKTDRINRAVIGIVLIIAAVIGMSKVFYITIGLILVIEGMIGWCSIPYLFANIKQN